MYELHLIAGAQVLYSTRGYTPPGWLRQTTASLPKSSAAATPGFPQQQTLSKPCGPPPQAQAKKLARQIAAAAVLERMLASLPPEEFLGRPLPRPDPDLPALQPPQVCSPLHCCRTGCKVPDAPVLSELRERSITGNGCFTCAVTATSLASA